MRHLSTQTFQCGVTIQGSTTLSGVTYLTALTNTSAWDYVVVGTSAQGQLFTRTYAQLMSDISSGITLSLDGLSDVVAPTPLTGQLLRYNGVQWANWTPTYYSLPSGGTTSQYIDGTGALQSFPNTLTAGTLTHQVKAGVAINKGQAVYVSSADGTNMIVSLASNTSEATSSKTMGLLDATVAINGFANVVTEGLLAGLDTTGAITAGDPVWLGTGGNLIYGLANKPYAPAHLVFIGIVTRINANNGEIFVKVQNGFELEELHNVDLKTTTPVNGELLGFNGTLWVNKTIAGWLGYTPVSGTGTTNYLPKFTGSTSLGNSSFFDNGTSSSIWINSQNATSRFYFTPVHPDGRINFGAIAGSADNVLIRAWHDGGKTGFGTGSSAGGGALTTYGDSVLIGPSGAIYFMNSTFGPNNVPYRLGIGTSSTATYFSSGVSNNLANIESNEFIFTAKAHTFYTGTTTGNQSNPNQYTPLFLSTAGNVVVGSTTDSGYKFEVKNTSGSSALRISNNNDGSGMRFGISNGANSQYLDLSYGVTLQAFAGYNLNIAVGSAYGVYLDSSNNVGIGTNAPAYKMHVAGSLGVVTPGNASAITLLGNNNHSNILKIQNTDSTSTTFGLGFQTYSDGGSNRIVDLVPFNSTGNNFQGVWNFNSTTVFSAGIQSNYWQDFNIYHVNSNAGQAIKFWSLGPTGSGGVIVSFVNTGNVLIGTTTDSGYRLDVNGTARINSSLYVTDPSYTGSGRLFQNGNNTLTLTGGPGGGTENITFGPSNRIFINASQTRVSSLLQTAGGLSVGTFGYPSSYGAQAYISGSTTANAGGGRGLYIDSTIVAAANNDVLVGLDINPTFTNGAFTGVSNLALRVAYSSGRYISFRAAPGYADFGQIVFSNVTGADIISSGTIGLGPSDTYKTLTLGNGITSKITTPGSTKYDGYGNQQPPTLAVSTNLPFLFTSNIPDGSIDGFIFENLNSGSRNLFKVIQNNTTLFTLNPNGNVLIGTTTDSGYKLDINGNTRITGTSLVYSNLATETVDLEVYRDFSSVSAARTATFRITTKNTTGNHGYQQIDFRHEGINSSPSAITTARINNFSVDGGSGSSIFTISTRDTSPYAGSLRNKIVIDQYGNIQLTDSTDAYVYLGNTYTYGPRTGKVITVAQQPNTGFTGDHLILRGGSPYNFADRTGGDVILQGGYSTGTQGSNIYFQVPVPAGSSSSTLNTTYQTVMYLSSGTNVGIGTTSPSQKLHVAGNLRLTGALYDSNNQAGTAGQILKSTGTGTDWVSLSEITGVDGTGTANYLAKWSDADTITNSQIYDNGTSVTINATSGGIYLNSNIGSGWPVNINDQFKFYYGQLQGSGNAYFTTYLSVGTSSNLGATLNVRGAGATSATKSLYIPNSDDSRTLSYTDDGKLTLSNGTYTTKWYIGNSYSPTLEFSAQGQILWGNGASLLFASTGDTTSYRIDNGTFLSNNSQGRFYAGGSGYLGFQTYGSTTAYDAIGAVFTDNNTVSLRFFYKNTGSDIEGMRLTSSGNFLIGTTTDSGYKLNVAGTTQIASSSGNYKLVVKTTGSGNGAGLLVDQLGYTMLDVNASDVYMRPFPNTYSKIDFYNWSAPGGVHNTFVLKNTEFTPQGGYAIPLVRFPDNTVPVVIGNTATASLRSYFTVGGTFTAKSSLGSGQSITTSLSASANNDVLVGLDINPTFTNGAFTGVSNFSLRAYGYSNFQNGINIYPGNPVVNSSGIPIQGALFTWGGGDTVNYYAGYQSGSGFYHKFWTNSTERVRISDGYTSIVSGNLLVGTTIDSGYKLDVNGIFRLGPAGGQLYSTVGNTLQANFGNAQFAVGSSGGESIDLSANSTGEIRFGTASTQRMVIKNDGNVGIGTNLPAYKLDVVGGIRSTYLTTSVVHGEGNTLLLLSGLNGANPGVNEARLHLGYNQNDPVVRLNSNGVSVNTGTWVFLPQIWFAGGITSNHNTALTIDGMSNGVTSGTAGEIIRFTQRNGQFASFYDAGAGLSEFRIWQQTNSSNYIYLKPGQTSYFSTGSLVIGGTTDSGYKLDVNGTVRFGDLGNVYYATLTSGGADGGIFRVGGASYGYAQLQSYALTLNGGHGISGTGGTAQFSITSQVSPSAAQSNAAIRFVADNPGSGGGTWGAYSTALAFNFLKKETSGSYTSILAMNGGTNNVGIGTTTPGSKLTIDGVLANNIGITLQDSGTWRSSYFVGNGGTFINAWSNGLHLGVDGNNLMKFTWDSKIGVGQLSPTARFQIKGSGSTSATTSLLVENSVGTTVFTVKDDGYIRPYYGINFGSDSPSTGNGGLIYPYDSGVAIQAYGASAGNSRYGRLEVGRVIPTSNFLGYFVGTTIGTNSTVFGATSDGSNVSTWFYFGDNLSNIVVSAIVNIDSTTRGFLQPRMTNTQVNAISTPATGLQAYDTTNNKNMLYDSTAWRNIATETWVTSQNYVPQARTLTINGTTYDLSANRSWTIATTTPGGSNTQFQYNNGGSLAGASALTYNSTTNRVGINQASPGYDLDVNGQVRVQDKLRVGNVNSGNGVVHMSSSATINPNTTTIVWSQNVSVGMCAFIEYYILNNTSGTDQRAGKIIVTWNQSGTPTIAHTETTTPDIGSTTAINFTSSLVGSDARINAVNSSANPYTIVMSYKYF